MVFVHCVSVLNEDSVVDNDRARPFDMKHVQTQLENYYLMPSVMWQRFGYPIAMPVEDFYAALRRDFAPRWASQPGPTEG